jgi:predicted RNA methylase
VPEARWVCADIFDLPGDLGCFDTAIANPPFGHIERSGDGRGYTGRRFEYHAIAVAATLARRGTFIVPQESVIRSNTAP